MHLSFQLKSNDRASFLDHWATKYDYGDEEKYLRNIGRPLTKASLQELFEWKNGSIISKKKTTSIAANYPVTFSGDQRARYLNHNEPGGAIWNIFYLHCLDQQKWPIFDQHTFRAMQYIKTARIVEIGSTNKQKYACYESEYIPFLKRFDEPSHRRLDMALFAFGQFLKLAAKYA